jgi:hypothetical protein
MANSSPSAKAADGRRLITALPEGQGIRSLTATFTPKAGSVRGVVVRSEAPWWYGMGLSGSSG